MSKTHDFMKPGYTVQWNLPVHQNINKITLNLRLLSRYDLYQENNGARMVMENYGEWVSMDDLCRFLDEIGVKVLIRENMTPEEKDQIV